MADRNGHRKLEHAASDSVPRAVLDLSSVGDPTNQSYLAEPTPRTLGASYGTASFGARRYSMGRRKSRGDLSFGGSRSMSLEDDADRRCSGGYRTGGNSLEAVVEMTDVETQELLAKEGRRYGSAVSAGIDDPDEEHKGNTNVCPTKEDLETLLHLTITKPLNVLLIFLPFGWASYHFDWGSNWVFWLNFLSMVPLASMLGDFTEELALHTGETIGGLINATFGNAVEVVVAIQALCANQIRVVQASMLGSVLSNLLLVLGTCFFAGGLVQDEKGALKYPALRFNSTSAVANMSLLLLSSMAMVMPTLGANTADDVEVPLFISRVSAACLMLMYILLLVFQLYTHSSLFQEEHEDDEEADLSATAAAFGLGVTTMLVSFFSEFLVSSIDGLTESGGLTKTFVGIIILPVVGNAVEHVTAVSVAMKGKMELAMGVALGSATQVAIFVVPVVVLSGWIIGRKMSLAFPVFEIALYSLALLIVGHVVSKGHSNWLEGSMLMMTYILIGLALYFEVVPDDE
uniref:Sodium/calcium exchanger membrane region domain-containing protein n=1 Tax=Phaeomonas parva TaxID=124430 RepID=A0A6U4DQR1_9STRA|mmetsp:Transcript_17868/g.54680  ORF Transcript_17868/g.54680 Transcript_17868/m.54680 type:complete len:517 (+) Transcript_17868:255-1805(+)